MPIPAPKPDEDRDTYVSRCVSFLADESPDMSNEQRVAICFKAWRNSQGDTETMDKDIHPDFKRILRDFIKTASDGVRRFEDFIKAYKLDITKSYADQITRECVDGFCEAFQWTKPMIQYWREDEDGKYYKVRALTATVSMNQNDYTEIKKIEDSAPTLTYRPLNINHDYNRWLPFPSNRVEWAAFEDNAVECIIRIDNEQADVQSKIENGEIVNPSIEARPLGGKRVEGKYKPDAWNFTGMALLEKSKTIPGVPTTYGIELLPLNEGFASGLVESVDWRQEQHEVNKMSTEIEYTEHDSASPEHIKEYWGIDGMTSCGQCKFFEMTAPTTTKQPSASGDGVKTDAFVTTTHGLGFNVGKCKILSEIQHKDAWVKSSDWCCQEGRPRDTPITVNRSTQNASSHESIEDKAMNEALRKQVDELNGKLLDKDTQIDREKREKAELRVEVTTLQEKLSNAKKESNTKESKVTSLTGDRLALREQLDKLKDELADAKLKLEREQDNGAYYEKNLNRVKEELTSIKEQHSLTKQDLERALIEKNEESLTRATAQQQSANDRDAKNTLLEENSLLHQKIAEEAQKVSDYAENNRKLSKQVLDMTREISELKKQIFEATEELKETHRDLNSYKSRPSKITVKM